MRTISWRSIESWAWRVEGADLVHVFCPPDAAVVIKGYSPELIVHPILFPPPSPSLLLHFSPSRLMVPLRRRLEPGRELGSEWEWLGRMQGVVLGPGLGREAEMGSLVAALFARLSQLNIPVVVDAVWDIASINSSHSSERI